MAKVVVIGGTNVDYYAKPNSKFILGESHPGNIIKTDGGVGRNIAENLGRFGIDTVFATIIGNDEDGKKIAKRLHKQGVVLQGYQTGSTSIFFALLDEQGDLVGAVSDMPSIEAINAQFIDQIDDVLASCDYIVLDANLEFEILNKLFTNYANKRFVIEAISSKKAKRLKPFLSKTYILKVNLKEAKELSGSIDNPMATLSDIGQYFVKMGVATSYITMGEDGVVQCSKLAVKTFKTEKIKPVNTIGAGDAFLAGVIYADIYGKDPILYGFSAAQLALRSQHAVSQEASKEMLETFAKRISGSYKALKPGCVTDKN